MAQKAFQPPYRVGRKQSCVVLDANGIEVMKFPNEDLAHEYCIFKNMQPVLHIIEGDKSEFLPPVMAALAQSCYSVFKTAGLNEKMTRKIDFPGTDETRQFLFMFGDVAKINP